MSKKFLGRVIAGAALGGTSLLVFAPAVALADSGHGTDGGPPGPDETHHADTSGGHIVTPSGGVKPGGKVELLEICTAPQQYPFVWSEPTGKIKLKPKDPGSGGQDHEQAASPQPSPTPSESPLPPSAAESSAVPEPTGPPMLATATPAQPGSAGGATSGDDSTTSDSWSTDGGMGSAEQDSWYGQEGRTYDEPGVPPDTAGPMNPHGQQADKAQPKDTQAGGVPSDEQSGMAYDGQHGYDYWATITIGEHTQPGHYDLKGSCAEGVLVVLPNGWVDGGDGGSTTGGNRALAGGVGMLGAAALGGLVLMRPRRTDGAPL